MKEYKSIKMSRIFLTLISAIMLMDNMQVYTIAKELT